MKKIYFIAIAVFLLISSFSKAQEAIVKGKITDEKTKESLIGVNVVLEDNTGSASDINGNYELKVSPGKHTLTYRFIGYTSQTKSIEVKEGETLTMNIVLKEEITELGIVVVSAGKFEQKIEDITVSMEVIKPNIVENKATTNMQNAVNQSPGVQIVDSEVQIRGGSGYSFGAGSRVMILVDDLPLLTGDAGRPSWGFLPVENLEQIEVIKGASSVLYGSAALNGAINIRTAYPKDKPQTKINMYSGIYDNPKRDYAKYWDRANPTYTGMNFFHSRKVGNLDVVIGGNLFSDQGYIGPEPEEIVAKKIGTTGQVAIGGQLSHDTLFQPTQFFDPQGKNDTIYRHISTNTGKYENRARLNANLRYRSKKIEGLNFGVNLNGMFSRSATTLIMLNTDTGMYRSFPGAITQTLQTTFNVDPFLNYYDSQGNRHSLRTRYFYQDNKNDNNQANQSGLMFGEYQFQKKFESIKDFTITTGVVGIHSNATSQLYIANEDSSGVSTATNYAAYLQLDKKFWEKLTFSAGARYEYFDLNGVTQGKPVFRTGLSYRLLKETYVGYRFPTMAEKFIRTAVGPMQIYPNHEIESETSWNAEIGIKQGVKIGEFYGYLDVAGFRQEIQNAIEFNFGKWGTAPFNSNNMYGLGFKSINIGNARIQGVDASLVGGGKLGPVAITMLAGYTYMQPLALTPNDTIVPSLSGSKPITYKNTSSDTSGIMKYRVEHLARADVEFTYKKFMLGLSYRYNSFMKNLDKIFLDLDKNSSDPFLSGTLPTGIIQYRDGRNGKGDYVFDLRTGYQLNETSKVTIVVLNMLNREYMIRPLTIESPRTFVIQYTYSM
jgi:outer membrane receptor protein involved in Fe transport